MCNYGYAGTSCQLTCPVTSVTFFGDLVCSGHGTCGADGTCSCHGGFSGRDCSRAPCPTDSTGAVCGGGARGACVYSALTGRPTCRCVSGFFGSACQSDRATIRIKKVTKNFAVAAAQSEAAHEEQEAAVCRDEANPYLCPSVDAVAVAKRDTCQRSRGRCGDRYKRGACKARAGMRWCGVSCISNALRCPRTRACKVGRVRCADGSCAGRADKCGDASSLCADAREVPCGDGITCAPSAAACRATVQLDGCPVGQLACKSNPNECRATKKDCRCDDGTRFCGWQRNGRGRLLKQAVVGADGEASLAKMPVCKTECGGNAVNPLAASVKPASMQASPLEDMVQQMQAAGPGGNGASLGSIRIPKGVVVAAGAAAEAVSFAVTPVALADATDGAFKGMDLMSVPFSLVADRAVEIDSDVGIAIDLCITDDSSNATWCDSVLARLRPFSSQVVFADVSDAQEVVGGCRRGAACGCSCLFSTPHLTSFVIADPGIAMAGEVSSEQLVAGVVGQAANGGSAARPPSPAPVACDLVCSIKAGDIPLIPAACAGAVVALLLALAVARRRRRSKAVRQVANLWANRSGSVAWTEAEPGRVRGWTDAGGAKEPHVLAHNPMHHGESEVNLT